MLTELYEYFIKYYKHGDGAKFLIYVCDKFDISEAVLMNAAHGNKSQNCIITTSFAASGNVSDLCARGTCLETVSGYRLF
jgi:hypothetical protein